MLEIYEPGLLESDLGEPVNLFLGAGFSTLAKNAASKKLPTGGELKDAIVDRFKQQDLRELDLQSVYTIVASERRVELEEFLKDTFSVTEWKSDYGVLRGLHLSHIYTTNIDDLAFYIFGPRENESSPVFHDVIKFGQPRDTTASIQCIPLHGCVKHDKPNYVFTSGQISSAFVSDQQTWYVFQRELQTRPTFFLGYGMQDAGVLQSLHNSAIGQGNRWILLRPQNAGAAAIYKTLGFHVLIGDISDFLTYLQGRTNSLAVSQNASSRPRIGRIPPRDEIAQRPIREFFLGAEPSWSDAYSQQVPRRRVNGRVLDLALSGKSVAVVGLPLSGKSTILRQVAVDLAERRSCIFLERLTIDLADTLAAEYFQSSSKPIVILDQFIDSRDGFNRLASAGGFKFVIAESSVFFDSINIKKLSANLTVVPCSEVDRPDLQRIIDAIPSDVRRQNVQPDRLGSDVEYLGLFEGLVAQVFDRELTARFRSRLSEFEQRDQQAFDVYLMACYANQCRTLVSYDMMYMFIGSSAYDTGYKVADRIRQFIHEREDAADNSQDHFSVRSAALARIAYKVSSRTAFGRIFRRFHQSISNSVIPDYLTFRRYAYDNDFAVKAFPDFRDGKVFYERLFSTADNPYDYQHGAVYMSKLRQHALAFDWIDRALSKSGGRIFSIRNSHAVILFEANVEIYQADQRDQTALDGLRQSMEVLEKLIEQDNWRRYHLLRFADQAMKMASINITKEVKHWLEFARTKIALTLEEALRAGSRESYNASKYRRLLRDIDQTLLS